MPPIPKTEHCRCFSCSLPPGTFSLEFDYWDHAAQTGNDTEYTFVILGLCVGALYTFARAVFKISGSSRTRRAAAADGVLRIFFQGSLNLIVKSLFPASPPLTALRV